jgi:hypothetical protein
MDDVFYDDIDINQAEKIISQNDYINRQEKFSKYFLT